MLETVRLWKAVEDADPKWARSPATVIAIAHTADFCCCFQILLRYICSQREISELHKLPQMKIET